MFEFAGKISSTMVLAPIVKTADVASTSVDLLNFGSNQITALIGASGDTLSSSVKLELEVQESSDNSTFTAVADADLSSSVTGTNVGTFAVIDASGEDSTLYQVEYRGKLRYLKVNFNFTGTHTNGTPVGAVIDRSNVKDTAFL